MESIKRYWRQIGFIGEEALASITRSGWMSWVVVMTMAVSLTILGGFWLLSDDLYGLARSVGSKVEIMVFTEDSANVNKMASDIRAMDGVSEVSIIPKDEAWNTLQRDMKGRVRFDALLENPLPDTVRVKVKDSENTPAVAAAIADMKGVEDLNWGQSLHAKIQQIATFTRLIGILITGLLMAATFAVIGNTIRLAVQSRRKEIEIMQLVGAGEAFIHSPFLLEGMIFGLAGALLTGGALAGWRTFIITRLQELFPFVILNASPMVVVQMLGYLIAIGVGIGILASWVSVRRHLRRQTT
ncbi:Cell division protein FtsX [compost metagenome]